jgi:molybdopterin molybdotransferase
MISFVDARELIIQEAVLQGTEPLPLASALHRVLAQDIYADRDYPPFNRAAMDGYALRFQEYNNGIRSFKIVETIFAGSAPQLSAAPGECYKIMTGAAVPPAMDLVIRVEDTETANRVVSIKDISAKPFQHIAKQAEDLKQQDLVLKAPFRCNAAVLSVLAAMGISHPQVFTRPRVTLITTGNEVVAPDHVPSALQIRNSNAALLTALLEKQQIKPDAVLHLPDDLDMLEPVFRESLHSDIVITCGGVSAGEADYIPGTWEKLGVKKIFHKLSIKPGKPVWCGKSEGGTMIFGLPGNPFSCMVTFKLFVEAYILACYGLPPEPFRSTVFNGSRQKRSSLDEFFPVRFISDGFAVEPLPYRGSGDIIAALHADALAWHPATEDTLSDGPVKILLL